MYEVVFRRLLVRLEAADPGRWVVKGGVALLLRLDPNRTSDDIDLTYLHAVGKHAIAIAALERAFAIDTGDFFYFALDPVAAAAEPVDDETIELPVIASIGDRPFIHFSIDLGRPALDVPSEPLCPRAALTGLDAVDALPLLRALALATQVGQKVCAMFERHGAQASPSSRARDLVDVAMIAMQVETLGAAEIISAVRHEERLRLARKTLHAPLPPRFVLHDDQARDWRARWARATRQVPISFDEAFVIAEALLTPVLAGTASGVWRPVQRRWHAP